MASKLVAARDIGNCDFAADFDTGQVSVTVRAPLTIDKRTVQVPITDFLEIATQIMLASFQVAKQMREQLIKADGQKPA